jgi:uncharacterized protein YjbI with pentapeptide repeats
MERLFTHDEKRSLQRLTLTNICFDYVDFSGADLSHAVFESVSLVGCDFRGARLTLATLHRCDLRDAQFDQSTLFRGGRFGGSSFVGAVGLSRSARDLIKRGGGILLPSVVA